jgi:hypothetical protein
MYLWPSEAEMAAQAENSSIQLTAIAHTTTGADGSFALTPSSGATVGTADGIHDVTISSDPALGEVSSIDTSVMEVAGSLSTIDGLYLPDGSLGKVEDQDDTPADDPSVPQTLSPSAGTGAPKAAGRATTTSGEERTTAAQPSASIVRKGTTPFITLTVPSSSASSSSRKATTAGSAAAAAAIVTCPYGVTSTLTNK